jgi:hypothetical protein
MRNHERLTEKILHDIIDVNNGSRKHTPISMPATTPTVSRLLSQCTASIKLNDDGLGALGEKLATLSVEQIAALDKDAVKKEKKEDAKAEREKKRIAVSDIIQI